MASRILRLADNGDFVGEQAVQQSAGATDAGRVPVLGEDGSLHPSFVRGYHVHEQLGAADTWVVVHNLGKRVPAVTVLDETGDTVFSDVHYDSVNQLTLLFSEPLAGTAFCN